MKLKKLIKIAMGLAAARAAAKGGRGYGRGYGSRGYGGFGGQGYGYGRRKPSMKARLFQMLLSRLSRR